MSGALPSLYVYLCANSRPSCIEIEGLGQRTRTFLRLWSKYPTCAPNLACANSKSAGFIRLLRLFTAAGVHPIFLVRIKPQESSPGCNIHELFRPVLSAQVGYFDQSCENVRLLSALRHVAVPPCPNAARFGVGWTPIRRDLARVGFRRERTGGSGSRCNTSLRGPGMKWGVMRPSEGEPSSSVQFSWPRYGKAGSEMGRCGAFWSRAATLRCGATGN